VGQAESPTIRESSAERVGFVRGLYSSELDEIWTAYERRLPEALDALSASRAPELDAELWLRVLVPFVAALLLRGPDFEERFTARLGPRAALQPEHNGRDARVIELQRLLAPVTAARWVVMHPTGGHPVITSDVGWAPYRDGLRGELGLAIPLDTRTILGLVPMRTRPVLRWRDGSWFALIEHRDLPPANHDPLNGALALFCGREVFGPTRESVAELVPLLSASRPGPTEPFPFGPLGGRNAVPNEFTWHRLVTALRSSPGDPGLAAFVLDFSSPGDGWYLPLMFPMNLPEFPPALRLKGGTIEIALFTVFRAELTEWELAQDVPMTYPPPP
jgi:hypothetical protein